MIESPWGYFDGASAVSGLSGHGGDSDEVQIRDAAGTLVRSVAIAPRTGILDFQWDGLDQDGNALESGDYHILLRRGWWSLGFPW